MSKTSTAQDWAEYTDPTSGKKYYHNKLTNERTWHKPNFWKEYTTENGVKYYYNTETKETTWEMPKEYKEALELKLIDPRNDRSSTDPKDIFKYLLEDSGVTSTWTWEMALKKIASDDRYQVIKTVPERKIIFQDYQTDRRKIEREEKRKKDMRIRQSFVEMLGQIPEIVPTMPWRRALPHFEGDKRFQAVPEDEREKIYLDYLKDLEKQIAEKEIAKKHEARKAFKEKLEEDSFITYSTQWRKIKEQFNGDPAYEALTKLDRLEVFEDYIRDLEKEYEERKRSEAQAKRKQSRKVRDDFRNLLNEKYESGVISVRTKWIDFFDSIKNDPRYTAMISPQQTGSLASEMFGDFVEDLYEKFLGDIKKIRQGFEEIGFEVTETTKKEEYLNQLKNIPSKFKVEQINHDIIYDELIKKAKKETEKKKKIESDKRLLSLKKELRNYIEDAPDITYKSNWDDVSSKIPSKFNDLDREAMVEVFNEYVKKRSEADSSEEEGVINSSSSKKKQK